MMELLWMGTFGLVSDADLDDNMSLLRPINGGADLKRRRTPLKEGTLKGV